MVVNVPLDYTPQSTISTTQFRSETLNVIIASLLTVLILANIGSAVSKLVYFTRQTRFNFQSWVRAFVFANSDDPIRILTWLFRGYAYRDRKWKRAKTRLRLGRLALPLLARCLVLLASIASVAITLPGEKELDGCKHADYRLKWDPEQAMLSDVPASACLDVPLESSLGSVRSSAEYCEIPNYSFQDESSDLIPDPGWVLITATRGRPNGVILQVLTYVNETYGTTIYVEWKKSGGKGVTFRSDIESLDLATQMNITMKALKRDYPSCTEIFRFKPLPSDALSVAMFPCFLNDLKFMIRKVESHLRNALVWERVTEKQRRVKIGQRNGKVEYTFSDECPLRVVVNRPLVNIIPLALLLVLWFCVNVVVSYGVSKHANVLDAAFHIIQETLGHDTQANPLEENETEDENNHLDLFKWNCTSSDGGHVGFIGRQGDSPVNEFEKNLVIGGCAQGRTELAAMRARLGGQNTTNGPGTSSMQAWHSKNDRPSPVVTTPVPSTPSTSEPGISGGLGAPTPPPLPIARAHVETQVLF